MNDQNTSDEQPDSAETPEAAPDGAGDQASEATADQATNQATDQATDQARPARRFLPTTAAGRTRLAAAGIAGAFFLGGGLGGYAIGQAGDGHDRGGVSRFHGFDGDGSRGPGGGPGGQQGQQPPAAPGGTESSAT